MSDGQITQTCEVELITENASVQKLLDKAVTVEGIATEYRITPRAQNRRLVRSLEMPRTTTYIQGWSIRAMFISTNAAHVVRVTRSYKLDMLVLCDTKWKEQLTGK